MRHDQLFKDLVAAFFGDLLRLVMPAEAALLRLEEIAFKRGELFTDIPQGRERRLDLVAEVPLCAGGGTAAGSCVLAHVEVEGKARASMGPRLRRYAMQLELRHDCAVVSMVLYRTGGPRGVRVETVRRKLGSRQLASFCFFAFGLARCSAAEFVGRPEPLAWALAALMRRGRWSTARHKLECLRPIAEARLDDARRFLLANFVETYIELTGEAVAEYQRLLAEEANQEVATMELTWADKIEARGREEGLSAGRQEGKRELLLRLLERRFGSVPEAVRQRIRRIVSAEELNRLADAVLVARSWREMGLDRDPS